LPEQPIQKIIEIDFSSVVNSDFVSGSSNIYIQHAGWTVYYYSIGGSGNIPIGSTLSDTIDNTKNFLASQWGQFSVTRTGDVIRVDTCPTSGSYTFLNSSYNFVYGGMSTSPVVSVIQEYSPGFLSQPTFIVYSGQNIDTAEVLNSWSDGSFSSKWGLRFPLDLASFAKQIAADMVYHFETEYQPDYATQIEEYWVPSNFNTIEMYNDYASLTEVNQSNPDIYGDIDGVLLSELMKVENGTAFINTSEIVGVISQTDVEAGKLITPGNNGFVVSAVPDDVSAHQHIPYYIALTSGKQIKARLINPDFYLYNITGTSSSSSGNSSGG
ncbi:MAG: hypothetical protein JWN78_389, partial [Bacteroidota bacterium]|nr:hypothetical protein [Bacteroidota bacterium]